MPEGTKEETKVIEEKPEEKPEEKVEKPPEEKPEVETQAPTFNDFLTGRNKAEEPDKPEVAAEEKPPEDKPEEKPEDKSEEKPEKKPEEKPEVKPEESKDDKAYQGALAMGLDERRRRQTAEARVKELEAAGGTEYVDPDAEVPASAPPPVDNRFIALSEKLARKEHSDYDEKKQAFLEHVTKKDPLTGDLVITDQTSIDNVNNSSDPGEACYQAGLALQYSKKYGTYNPLELAQKIRDEEKPKIEKEIRADIEKEMSAKAKAKANTPTNIDAMPSASGDAKPDFRPRTFAEGLRIAQKR